MNISFIILYKERKAKRRANCNFQDLGNQFGSKQPILMLFIQEVLTKHQL
jgi:hypothetical protein